MVSGGKVSSDLSSLSTILEKYSSEISNLSSSWKGSSYDNLVSKSSEFVNEYTSTISGEMDAFASACDLYEKYESTKNSLDSARDSYNRAVSSGDKASASTYNSQITTYSNELESLKSQINSLLETASAVKLTGSETSVTADTTSVTGDKSVVGDLDMSNYPTGSSRADGIQRAVLVAKYLMKNGGFTAEQAAAIVGVYIDENNCNPGEVMQAEKDGKGASGTGGNGYGAGIGSWTYEETKKQCLKDAGFSENTKIEDLSLQQQCDMVIAVSQKSGSKYYNALKRCDSIEDASATAVIITGGVGSSSHWDTHPTAAEAKALSDKYGRNNDARFGKSDYHWNMDKRRLDYAKQVYALL